MSALGRCGVTGLVPLAAARRELRWLLPLLISTSQSGLGFAERHWHRPHAADAVARSGGGQTRRSAIVLRFCTMAARWNSSRRRSRSRSKPWWVFKCAKRISCGELQRTLARRAAQRRDLLHAQRGADRDRKLAPALQRRSAARLPRLQTAGTRSVLAPRLPRGSMLRAQTAPTATLPLAPKPPLN